jgi:uncharacterized repeat protein (TIGR03803 family)
MTRLGALSCLCLICTVSAMAAYAQTFTTLASFRFVQTGAFPQYMSLAEGNDGNLYGTAPGGGVDFVGTVFKITTSGELTFLCYFDVSGCPYGADPLAGLIHASDGNLYGTAWQGNASGSNVTYGWGTIFGITTVGQPITLYGFCSQTNCADGGDPFAPLMQASDGKLYGTAFNGGAKGYGTVFAITTSGTFTSLHSFRYADGAGPVAGLIQGKDGNFYGTTVYGGAHDAGTVFQMTPAGKLKTLHSFGAAQDGAIPYAALVQASDGNFYGITYGGGTHGHGTVYRITASGQLTTLYNFCSQKKCADGASPYAGLIQASDGNLYGATSKGGASNWGMLYAITPAGQLTALHSFCGKKNCVDGAYPLGGLLQASDGNLYGTTAEGGTYESGTVYRLSLTVDGTTEAVRFPLPTGGATTNTFPPTHLPGRDAAGSLPWLQKQLPHPDPSAHAPGPIHRPGGFNCSPAPCVLPPTQASEGGDTVTVSPVLANPLNPKELLLGSVDFNCPQVGFHLSRDGGSTWVRTLCMPPIFKPELLEPGGEPLVAFDRHGVAYVFCVFGPNGTGVHGAIGFSKSKDGTHWSQPRIALQPPGASVIYFTSMVVDTSPKSPWVNSVYASGVMQQDKENGSFQILVAHSTDGGRTWKQTAVDRLRRNNPDNYTRMAVGKNGTVYLAWLHCPAAGPDQGCLDTANHVTFSKSLDGGNTWSAPRDIATVRVTYESALPNTNGIGVANYPVIAVDDSDGPYSGNLYIATYHWTGTHLQAQVIRSTDDGKTWSKPVPAAPPSDTHDQFLPTISVSPTGLLGVSWLDRRNDPGDLNYQAFAAISSDGGQSFGRNWQLTKAFSNPNLPGVLQDGYTGNTWAGNKFIAAWMDSSNGVDMQEVIGGVRLK